MATTVNGIRWQRGAGMSTALPVSQAQLVERSPFPLGPRRRDACSPLRLLQLLGPGSRSTRVKG